MVRLLATAPFIVTWIASVAAGPGVNVYACVNLGSRPSTPFTVSFDPTSGDNKCMHKDASGSYAEITVSDSGLSCANIGYVEAKTSSSQGDLCATDESIWNISYQTKGLDSNKSGSIKSRWRKMWFSQTNEIAFRQHAPGTMVCGTRSLCYSEEFNWDTGSRGPAYFIFQPGSQNAFTNDEVEQNAQKALLNEADNDL